MKKSLSEKPEPTTDDIPDTDKKRVKRPIVVWFIYIFSCFKLSAVVFETMALLGFIELPNVVERSNDTIPVVYLAMLLISGVLFYFAGYFLYKLKSIALMLFSANLVWYGIFLVYAFAQVQGSFDGLIAASVVSLIYCIFIIYTWYLKKQRILS